MQTLGTLDSGITKTAAQKRAEKKIADTLLQLATDYDAAKKVEADAQTSKKTIAPKVITLIEDELTALRKDTGELGEDVEALNKVRLGDKFTVTVVHQTGKKWDMDLLKKKLKTNFKRCFSVQASLEFANKEDFNAVVIALQEAGLAEKIKIVGAPAESFRENLLESLLSDGTLTKDIYNECHEVVDSKSPSIRVNAVGKADKEAQLLYV